MERGRFLTLSDEFSFSKLLSENSVLIILVPKIDVDLIWDRQSGT